MDNTDTFRRNFTCVNIRAVYVIATLACTSSQCSSHTNSLSHAYVRVDEKAPTSF